MQKEKREALPSSNSERAMKAQAELFREFGDDIDSWAKKSFSTTRQTVLIRSAQRGRADLVEFLLPRSDASAIDIFHNNALMSAAQAGSLECVRILLPASDIAGKDIIGDTALSIAAANGHAECMAELLSASAPAAINKMGFSLLMQAAHGRDPECVRMALAAGGDPRAANKMGYTALMAVVGWHRQGWHQDGDAGSKACLRLLLDAGADPLAQDKHGRSALMEASRHQSPECAKMLLGASDLEARDENGNTPLILAARRGGLETLAAVLALGDPLACNKKRQTPLGVAVAEDRFEHALMIFQKLRGDPRAAASEKALARIAAKAKAFENGVGAQAKPEAREAAKILERGMAAWAEGLKIDRRVEQPVASESGGAKERRGPRL